MTTYLSSWRNASDDVKLAAADDIVSGVDTTPIDSFVGIDILDSARNGSLGSLGLRDEINRVASISNITTSTENVVLYAISTNDDSSFSSLAAVYRNTYSERVGISIHLNEWLDVPAYVVDYEKLFKMDIDDVLEILKEIRAAGGDESKVDKVIYVKNVASKEKLNKLLVSSRQRHQNATVTVTPPTQVDLDTWSNTAEITNVVFPNPAIMDIQERTTMDDTGIKSIYLAVLLVAPGLLNSLLLQSVYESGNGVNEVVSGSVITRVKNDLRDMIAEDVGGDALLDKLATLFVLVTHKYMGYNQESAFSPHDFTDTRLFSLDIILSSLNVGIMIDGELVGSADNVHTDMIKIDDVSNVLTVVKQPMYGIFPGANNEVYIHDKVVSTRFYEHYDNTGHVDHSRTQDTAAFWDTVMKKGDQAGEYGNATIVDQAKFL
jgi:hypothetical protein